MQAFPLRVLICLSILSTLAPVSRAAAGDSTSTTQLQVPRVFILDGEELAATRRRAAAGDADAKATVERARERADGSMEAGPFSVTANDAVPPSGDKHDYQSQAIYAWPDPSKPDGLPYIDRDGRVNPEAARNSADKSAMNDMLGAVSALALGFYYTGDEKYAERAALLLRTWYLDPATRMNPNLNFGQAFPGRNTGRSAGLIETRGLPGGIDSVGLLDGSKAWTAADQRGMEQWHADFLGWLRTSPIGKNENNAANNHGSWLDFQRTCYALFAHKDDLAREILESVKSRRIDRQFRADGSQPEELRRTKAWWYSGFNLDALTRLAVMGESRGVDLWHYESPQGGSLRKGIDYMLPYLVNPSKEFLGDVKQIEAGNRGDLIPILRRANRIFHDPEWQKGLDTAATRRGAGGRRRNAPRADRPTTQSQAAPAQ